MIFEPDLFTALHRANSGGMDLGPLTFYTPTENIWGHLKLIHNLGVRFTECGSGMGTFLDEANKRGLVDKGVDINTRKGQSKLIITANACNLMWSPTHWPIICRPDHSGWANVVTEKALSEGARVLWIGLGRNFDRDLSSYKSKVERINPKGHQHAVGDEGENLYIIKQSKRRSSRAH